jgi:hypothetical protein
MNRAEDIAIERLDRKREAPAAKAARSARAMFLRMSARKAITALLADAGNDHERGVILGDLIDIAAEHRWPIIGRVETATGLNSVAADVCANLRLPRAISRARAEQLFTRAANDGGQADD